MFQPTTVESSALEVRAGATRLFYPAFAVLLLAAASPIFSVSIPPLADYLNHLARMYVIADIDHNPVLAGFYGIEWQIIPNLIMDLIVPVLARHMNIYLAGQVFIFATLVLMLTGVQAIHYAIHRHLSPWPLVGFLFIYNNIFLFGFMNYLFGLGVALWGLAAWIALRRRSPALRLGVSLAFVLVLFVCHLFAVGLYGLGLLCHEVWVLGERRPVSRRQLVSDAAVFGVPFLPVLPLMMASPTIGLALDVDWDWGGKREGLYYLIQNYSDLFDLSLGALIVAAGLWAAQRRLLSMHPVGWTLAAIGTAVFLAMPRVLFGSWAADLRLPVALVFMLIGFIRFNDSSRAVRYAFYAFVLGIAVARFGSVQMTWRNMDQAYDDFRRSIELIAPGSTILVAENDHPVGPEALNNPFSHAACLAMIDRASLVSTAFSVQGKQVLTVQPNFRDRVDPHDGYPPTVSELLEAANRPVDAENGNFWDRWPERFDYIYVLYATDRDNPAPDHLSLLYQGSRFQLYKVKPPAPMTAEDTTTEDTTAEDTTASVSSVSTFAYAPAAFAPVQESADTASAPAD